MAINCLRCGDKFVSEGSHNRLCRKCRQAISSINYIKYRIMQ